jgi:hypothetical protein
MWMWHSGWVRGSELLYIDEVDWRSNEKPISDCGYTFRRKGRILCVPESCSLATEVGLDRSSELG